MKKILLGILIITFGFINPAFAALEGVDSGLVGWWTLDEGSGVIASDSSGSGKNGAVLKSPAWVTGKLGSALRFTGSNTGTSITTTLPISYPMTGCAWINPVHITSGVVSRQILFTISFDFSLFSVDGKHNLILYNGKGNISTPRGSIAPGAWQHVCGAVAADGTATLYINGALSASGNIKSYSGGNLMIGDRGNYQTFNGDLDDIRIYNRVLSSQEVMELYHQADVGGPTTTFKLTVSNQVNGKITSNPSGIDCGVACTASFKVGAPVTLTAIPDLGYMTNWSGCGLTTSGNSCVVAMNADTTVTPTFMLIPPAPVISGVKISSITSSRATIFWTTDMDADTQVDYGLSTTYGNQTILADTKPLVRAHSVTLTNLQPDTVYHYRLNSKNQYGVLGQTLDATFKTNPKGPTAPDYVSAKAVSPTQVNIIWLRSVVEEGDVTQYTIYRDGLPIDTVKHVAYIAPYHDTEQQIYQDRSVSSASSYTYHITAQDSLGNNSPKSESVSVTTPTGPTALIPAERLANWVPGVTVGVPGGIPTNRSNMIDVTKPPYNADKTGVVDSTPAINAAINAAKPSDVIYLPEGKYRLEGRSIYLQDKSNITIRGDGMDKTFLDNNITVRGSDFYNIQEFTPIVSGLKRGSSQIVLTNAASYPPGKMIRITTDNDINLPVISPMGFPKLIQQKVLVTARSGNTLSITPPLIMDFNPASTYASPSNFNPSSFIGIEGLTIDGTNRPITIGLTMSGTYGSWIKDVRIKAIRNYSLSISDSLNCELRHSYLDELNHTGTNGAGLLMAATTGCLVEDNIVYKSFPLLEINFSSMGNVFAYNFMIGSEVNTNHGAHNSFNLYEGNYAESFKSDGYYGSESEATYFRNMITKYVAFKRFSRNFTVVGNIVGSYSLGQPNIGNGNSIGFAQQSKGVYWQDWNPQTGPGIQGVFTKISDSTGIVKLNSHDDTSRLYEYISRACNGLDVKNNPTLSGCKHPLGLDWGQGKDSVKIRSIVADSLDLTTDTLAVSVLYASGPAIPASGTMVGIWPRSEGFQELDMDVALTLIRKQNYVGKVGIPSYEVLKNGEILPESLYRVGKPSWFGSLAWPAYDPANPITNEEAIPAGYRYKYGSEVPGLPTAALGSGDVSGDNKITMYDAALVLRFSFGSSLSDVQKQKADINGDGKIDGVDVVGIARKAMGL